MTPRDRVIAHLNKLLKRNYDAINGYQQAAEDVSDPKLLRFFKTYVEQRYHFERELKGEIRHLGGDFKDSKGTSVTGDLHRQWMKLRKIISSGTEEAILEECRRGEMVTWEDYNEGLGLEDLPPTTHLLLKAHKLKIDEAIYQLMELKAEYAHHE